MEEMEMYFEDTAPDMMPSFPADTPAFNGQSGQQKQYKNVEPFWEVQGSTSFVKARADWMSIGKLHLSFVQHTGRNNGCKQVAAFESALNLQGADSALTLVQLIRSGYIYTMAQQSRDTANGGYAQNIFQYMGGSKKNGQVTSRTFAIAPGMKSDFVLSLTQCEGEVNGMGGIMPKKGAERTTIRVPVSANNLMEFAVAVEAEYTAYRTAVAMKEVEMPAPAPAAASPVAPQPIIPAQNSAGQLFCMVYDKAQLYNGGLPVITTLENATEMLRNILGEFLKMPDRLIADKNIAAAVAGELPKVTGKTAFTIPLAGKTNAASKDTLIVAIDALR